MLPW
jgi:hypothetical protein